MADQDGYDGNGIQAQLGGGRAVRVAGPLGLLMLLVIGVIAANLYAAKIIAESLSITAARYERALERVVDSQTQAQVQDARLQQTITELIGVLRRRLPITNPDMQ